MAPFARTFTWRVAENITLAAWLKGHFLCSRVVAPPTSIWEAGLPNMGTKKLGDHAQPS